MSEHGGGENPADVHLELIGDPEEGWEEVGSVIILTLYVIIAALVKLFFHQCRHGCEIKNKKFSQKILLTNFIPFAI